MDLQTGNLAGVVCLKVPSLAFFAVVRQTDEDVVFNMFGFDHRHFITRHVD